MRGRPQGADLSSKRIDLVELLVFGSPFGVASASGASPEAKSPLPLLSGVLLQDRNVSIGLICNHFPAAHQACQNSGFCPAL
jgi:hypothetical protein